MVKRKSSNSPRKGSNAPAFDLLKSTSQPSSSRTVKSGSPGDLTRLAIGSSTSARALSFGSPSDGRSKGSSKSGNGTSWTSLLGSTSSNGISDLLGGGGLLSTGLHYLSDSIASLFGGASDSPSQPLTRFALPDTQDQALYTNGAQQGGIANTPSGAYSDSQLSQLSQSSKSAIIQTVKHAILTSSSLNDVIGEL